MNNFFSWINKKEKREKAKELESKERSKVKDERERYKRESKRNNAISHTERSCIV